MNPGLVVKLRPVGPWRIGPDTGARNRVDTIYHSDTLYSAVTAAMARLGSLDEWLEATARSGAPAVSFSSCFPFLDEIGFVVPPRTIWPPTAPALMSARVRWKSARFVPLGIVQALLAGQAPDDSHWSVDGPSECLVPAGRLGPFRTGVRWNAAVDRLTGLTERHSTACIEFRAGAGLWTVVSFADEAARERWMEPVKAAFRLLADTGLGGERSRGWGRSEAPEFVEGSLPEMILGTPKVEEAGEPPAAVPEPESEPVVEPAPAPAPEAAADPEVAPTEAAAVFEIAPMPEAAPEPEAASSLGTSAEPEPVLSREPVAETAIAVASEPAPEPVPSPEPAPSAEPAPEPLATEAVTEAAPGEAAPPAESASVEAPPEIAPMIAPVPKPASPERTEEPCCAHWLLSLFTPAAADEIDWRRGNYALLARAGRIESPAGSGELKKTVQMVAEGSVVYATGAPRGSAANVAPEGFAHPVFRAGFAVAIPLPEVS